jgi:aminopeptidase YwaD
MGPRPGAGVAVLLLAGAAALAGCRSDRGMPSAEELAAMVAEAEEAPLDHEGPRVELGDSGPARFVRRLYNAFREERAMETVAHLDARHRTRGSEGFVEASVLVEEALRARGFGERPDLRLEVLEADTGVPAWNARSGELRLLTAAGGEAVLHAFEDPASLDRCLLPEHAPACDVEGPVALGLESVRPGDVLVTEAALRRDLLVRAGRAGAAAVVSASLASYNEDPSGREQHLDAIQFRQVPPGTELPVAQISPRSLELVRAAVRDGGARLRLRARVEAGPTTVRTLVATVVGAGRPDEAVVLSTHLEAPGANDNASGAAGLLEAALSLVRVVDAGGLSRPDRSVVFLWGPENDQVDLWLDRTGLEPVAAVSAVMIGESLAATGAVPLLERAPDPGAVETLPPDRHTLWGAREVDPEWLRPNGLSVVARCALVDVAAQVGGWATHENPYEGGTDHERFLARGVPAVLFWHFTDWTFHTSLDRLERVDGAELRRSAVAALVTALALADPRPGDLTRYLRSLDRERDLRVAAAEEAGRLEVAEAWRRWAAGARQWFRVLCLDLPEDQAWLPGPLGEEAAAESGAAVEPEDG